MTNYFKVGDVAVCVDDENQVCGNPRVVLNRLYRIAVVIDDGVIPEGHDPEWLEGWAADRFRKIDAPRTEIADRIRACKPAKVSA